MRIVLPGNCFCWAVILRCIYGGKIFTVANEPGAKGRRIRHYMLRDRTGKVRHFKRVFDPLPPPLCFFFFFGILESSGGKRKNDQAKRLLTN